MQLLHLPRYSATPLLILVAYCLGTALAGAIPKYHGRPDARSPPSSPHTAVGEQTAARPEVEIAQSRQRALLEKGKRVHEVPSASDRVRDNGTVVQQRAVKRAAGDYCEVEEEQTVIVYHSGQCKRIGGINACETDTYLDLGNSYCDSGSR